MKKPVLPRCILACFFISLLLPPALQAAGIRLNLHLSGVSEAVNAPALTAETFFDGSFQQAWDDWFRENLSVRDLLIRTGNQFLWTGFRATSNRNLTVGRENVLFETSYIRWQLQYDPPVPDGTLDDLVGKLERLDDRLQAAGKHLFIYISPAKTELYPSYIPWAYRVCKPAQSASDYERFAARLAASRLAYYDTVPFVRALQDEGMTVFPKTGTHWSQSTGALVARQLRSELCSRFGYDLDELSVEIFGMETPDAPDADLFETMNVFSKPYGSFTGTKVAVTRAGTDRPALFLRGGSFVGQSMNHLINAGLFQSVVDMENTHYVRIPSQEPVVYFSNYGEIPLPELLAPAELVILEVCENRIGDMSFGLIDAILDTGLPEAEAAS